jgi:hypothetical protein
VFLGVFLLTKSTARAGPSAAELAAAEKMRLVYATFEDEAAPSRRSTFDTIKALRMEEEEQDREEEEMQAARQTGERGDVWREEKKQKEEEGRRGGAGGTGRQVSRVM